MDSTIAAPCTAKEQVEVSLADIHFSPLSTQDTFGRVFFYNNRVFRLVNKQAEALCRNLFELGIIEALQTKNLIPHTTITHTLLIKEQPAALIVEHEKLVETFIGEWSFTMIKKAALCVLQVNEVLNGFGYALKDSHPYNLLFRGTPPCGLIWAV